MDAPSLCTVQALVILSGVEALLTRDARGWLYSGIYEISPTGTVTNGIPFSFLGMAMRLATDLGLHLEPLESAHREVNSATEMRLRKVVFWGAYIHDR